MCGRCWTSGSRAAGAGRGSATTILNEEKVVRAYRELDLGVAKVLGIPFEEELQGMLDSPGRLSKGKTESALPFEI